MPYLIQKRLKCTQCDSKARSWYSSKSLHLSTTNVTNPVVRDPQYKTIKEIKKNVELTWEDVNILVERALKGTADPINHPTLAASPTIPLEMKKEDYPLMQWWYPAKWLALKNRSITKPNPDGNIPIISLYMEDENGRAIPSGRKIELWKDVYCYWNNLYLAGSTDLWNFGKLGLKRKEDFCKTLKDRYKWLCLCEGHWKVDQLWVSYFSSWKRPCTSPDCKTKELSPISMAADQGTSPPPINSKRRFEEDETSTGGSSKRKKGKEVDLMAPTTFYHSRPASQKRVQKMAKVMHVVEFQRPLVHLSVWVGQRRSRSLLVHLYL